MDKMKISNTKFGIFKPMTKSERQEVHSNPFGINFKGNVLAADVFESSKAKETNASTSTNPFAKMTSKSKMVASAFVGSMNSFNEAFRSRINSIISFGRQIKENIANSWEYAKNTEIKFDFKGLTESIASKFNNQYSVNNLLKQPVDDLGTMFASELGAYKESLKA